MEKFAYLIYSLLALVSQKTAHGDSYKCSGIQLAFRKIVFFIKILFPENLTCTVHTLCS